MRELCRCTDIGVGICCCHSKPKCRHKIGFVITCSDDVLTDNLGAARVTDIVMATCGHVGVLVSGSPTTYVDGLPRIRIGDPFVGCFTGVMVTGSSTTFADE